MPDRLRLPFQFDVARLQADLASLPAGTWVRHFNTMNYEGEWSGVPLRAVAGSAQALYPDPTGLERYEDTPLLASCPAFQDVLAAFSCPIGSARLLKLAAGAHIREHTDYNLGFDDGEVRLHVPIVTHPDVAFFVAGQRVRLLPGECWYLDLNLPHRVDNPSDTNRVHLVLDCVVDDWLRGIFEQARAESLRVA
ncbi:aspartyl/asparaginyl beta-hydroxylase domain-containing protein [Corallococcus sp. H22C18031201]|nr:aspartyl/asparaginyl beta-hydroxylase domain-containing protein [Corallococcus sp. H22C18031201]